ncbi:hypothetical protein [Paenibacillus sp. MMS18-CY102]|uniref:hypothetical protein n=1 Tax=Paenibacillus sp. MMS18-CY102 TaxID=2682849 RepID=UPI0013654327|nr:hypothetical protein [Paenibacillus sp. MMS18-CY102]MWC31304.1 hypothetical protein [Paenibacillus sp. MMS18-CY102]
MQSAASLPFLRERQFLQAGDMVANIPLPDGSRLYEQITDHLLLAVISTSCADCLPALESLEKFANCYTKVNLVILAVTDESGMEVLQTAFDGIATVYHPPEHILAEELQIQGYPWAYGINARGQVVTSGHCGRVAWIERLLEPFEECLGSLR